MTQTANDLIRGQIHMHATAVSPIHHGGGNSGNTTMLRVQPVLREDGTVARIPFISGASWKHTIRYGAAMFALEAMGVERGTLSKAVVDLLFSGGHLSKGGSSVRLDRVRELEQVFPALSALGYSAGNHMTESKIGCNHWHLVCEENQFRMPESLRELPVAEQRAALMREEDFGTRHDVLGIGQIEKYLESDDKDELTKAISEAKSDKKSRRRSDSSQMIYEFQVVMAGSQLFSSMYLKGVSRMELAAIRSGLEYMCEGVGGDGGLLYTIGGMGSKGYGKIAVQMSGEMRTPVQPPEYTDSEELTEFGSRAGDSAFEEYVELLQDNADSIVETLGEVA